MRNAGFTRYTDFLRTVLTAVDAHAKAAGWLPVAYNLCGIGGKACAIGVGTPSSARLLLLRRDCYCCRLHRHRFDLIPDYQSAAGERR